MLAGLAAVFWHKPQPMIAAETEMPEQFEPEPADEVEIPPEMRGLGGIAPKTAFLAEVGQASSSATPEGLDDDSESDAEELMKIVDQATARGDWKAAARALETVTSEFRVPLLVWHYRALACLKTDDHEAYREICESLLDRVVLTPRNLDGMNTVAWLCAIGPKGVKNPERTVMLAKMLKEELPETSTSRHAFLNTIGAVYLRAGRWRDAIDSLMDGIEGSGGEGVEQDWLLLAMAHHGLKEEDEARRWMSKKPEGPVLEGQLAVWNRTEVELLREEATRVLSEK